jgi:hypothetical protein
MCAVSSSLLLAGDESGALSVWKLAPDGSPPRVVRWMREPHRSSIYSLDHREGLVLSCSRDLVVTWRLSNRLAPEMLSAATLDNTDIRCARFHPTIDQLVLVGARHAVVLFLLAPLRRLGAIEFGCVDPVHDMRLDDELLVTAHYDGRVRFFHFAEQLVGGERERESL